jgi:signal transduction histidine kinase
MLTKSTRAKYYLLFFIVPLLILTSCSNPYEHSNYQPDSVDVAKIRFARNMYKLVQVDVVEKNAIRDGDLPNLKITDSIPSLWRNRFPPEVIEKELILKFYLSNSSDSVQSLYLFPGAYYKRIRLFKYHSRSHDLVEIPNDSTPIRWRLGFRLFEVPPRDTSTYFARLDVLRSTATLISPIVLQKDFIEPFVSARIQRKRVTSSATYVVSGIMLMMIFYSLAAFRLNRNKEFLYYSGYAFCLGLLLFLKSLLLYDFTHFNFFFESYWDFLVQCLGVGFYFQFIRHFLDTRKRHPFLEKTFRISEVLITSLLAVYTILYFFTDNFIWLDFFENFTKQILLLIGIIFVIYGIRKHDNLMRWLVWGNILLILFSIISFLFIVTPFAITNSPNLAFLNDAIFYYGLGIALELIMFLGGLAYKNRRDLVERTRESERLKMENERKELEKQMAVLAAQQDERDRISADMHDELGSGVTAIRLMSEIVKSKMKEATLPEIDKISNSANDLITKMNTIIWTMTSSNDSLESLVTYIRSYAFEFFDNTNIECRFNMPEAIPKIELTGERRRNIFLAVKEALNNVLKHSKATNVRIEVEVTHKLVISIADNGLGIDLENLRRFGNGLRNMQNRLENINGKFHIKNEQGTIAILEIML